MVRLLIRASTANVFDWIKDSLMYVVQNNCTGYVLQLTNQMSCVAEHDDDSNMNVQKNQKNDHIIDLV